MTNRQVIEKFLDRGLASTPTRKIAYGYFIREGKTLQSDGTNLINYETKMAYFDNNNKLHINVSKYSVTTSKIQNLIKYLATTKNIDFVEYQGI